MFNKRTVPYKIFFLILLLIITITGGFFYKKNNPLKQNIKKETFELITKIRKEKKQEVIGHFKSIKKQAHAIKTDKKMRDFFTLMASKNDSPEIEFNIDKHYVAEYGNFYDILFIDSTGYVFHSIKKEDDYLKNIFKSDKISKLKIAQTLQKIENEGFVDLEFYPPSNEAASFFTINLIDKGKHIGWMVLQCETNRVNTILADRKKLGRTGEVYLVNKDKLMLSKSRFIKDNTILQQRVNTASVKEALISKSGEKLTTDYRGIKVFSSFEKFELFGAIWIIIVEIDEDEVITEYFKKHKKYLTKAILTDQSYRTIKAQHSIKIPNLTKTRVDMNEFARVKEGSYLITAGVATCTAIAISYPNKFGYMAHISPTDEIYIDNILTKYFLNKNYHNFLSDLLAQIKHYEIYPYEINKLQFVIVAPHKLSFVKSVESFLSHDIELANIKFLYNPNAHSADIIMFQPDYDVHVLWNENTPIYHNADKYENLGDIVKRIIRYNV